MNILHITILLSLFLSLEACNKTSSEQDVAEIEISTEEVINEMTEEMNLSIHEEARTTTETYGQPLCSLVTEASITAAFPDAQEITKHDVALQTPTCMVLFQAKEDTMSMTLTGLPEDYDFSYRKNLDNQLANLTDWKKLDNLGDEAYVFPKRFDSYVIVIVGELSYTLHLNSTKGDNEADVVRLARAVFQNIN